MQRMNMNVLSPNCILCDSSLDSADHLFFRCSWSLTLLKEIAEWLNIKYKPQSLKSLYRWLGNLKLREERKGVYEAVFEAAVYYIWISRCRKFHNVLNWDIKHILYGIREEIGVLLDSYNKRKRKCNKAFLSFFSL